MILEIPRLKGGIVIRNPFWLMLYIIFSVAILAACSRPTETPAPQIQTSTPPSTYTPIATVLTTPISTPTRASTITTTTKPTFTPTWTRTPVESDKLVNCPGAPDILLKLGDWAMVSMDPPLPNKVRSQPGNNSELIGQVQPGENVLVVDGPRCADSYTWWFVRSLEGLEGWTVEGDTEGYWLVDPISAWYQLPNPLTSQGVKTYDLRELKISANLALVNDNTGNYNPLATPLPRPQTEETPFPDDPRYSDFGTASYAAHSFYNMSGTFDDYFWVFDLEDPLSRYYLNHMSYNDCTEALRKNLESPTIEPEYLKPFCGINGGIPLLFKAGVKSIQFSGGEGVRYMIASGNYQTVNYLEYRFQGLSDDGRYYISGFFRPIIHPYIIEDQLFGDNFGWLLEWKEGQYEQAQKSYNLFNARIEELLNAGMVPLFPSLEFLDDMMASIVIK
jgi:hypothetical protein